MNKTSIAWCDYTSNPIRARNKETGKTGHYCTHVSEGCENCYAGVWNLERFGTGLDFIAQNRDKVEVFLNEDELREWSKPKYAGKRVFVADMTDWCHELVTDEMRYRMFVAMAEAKDVTFQLLTKRPERMREFCKRIAYIRTEELQHLTAPNASYWPNEVDDGIFTPKPLPNVWLGVTAENQRWADERIPILLDTPAAVRFVSVEPMLGPVDFERLTVGEDGPTGEWPTGQFYFRDAFDDGSGPPFTRIDWVIVGGESGANARPFDPQWARDVRDQCAAAGVACFVKQMGGKRFPDDRLESLPEDLRVREFPDAH